MPTNRTLILFDFIQTIIIDNPLFADIYRSRASKLEQTKIDRFLKSA